MEEVLAVTAVIFSLIAGFALMGIKAERMHISNCMFFITLGALYKVVFTAVYTDVFFPVNLILFVTELTLVQPSLTLRLLGIGFPFCLIAHFFFVRLLLPGLGVWGALLIAGSLTPTDAGLASPVVLHPRVPSGVRQGLNAESRLYDGLATPVVVLALEAIRAETSQKNYPDGLGLDLMTNFLIPFAVAMAVAAVVGPLFALAIDRSAKAHDSNAFSRATVLVVLPLIVFSLGKTTGANVFIASFLTGLAFGLLSNELHHHARLSVLIEASADIMSDVTWFLAGSFLTTLFQAGQFKWQWAVLAVCSLTFLRMIPVLIALSMSGLDFRTKLFISWMGPRGLATVVFALMVLEESDITLELDVLGPLLLTVLLSVFLHGCTMHICINVSFNEPCAGASLAVIPLPPGHVLLDLPVAHKSILHSRGKQHHHPYHRHHYGTMPGPELGLEQAADSDSLWQDLGLEERRYEYEDPLCDSAGLQLGTTRAGEGEEKEEEEEQKQEGEDEQSRETV